MKIIKGLFRKNKLYKRIDIEDFDLELKKALDVLRCLNWSNQLIFGYSDNGHNRNIKNINGIQEYIEKKSDTIFLFKYDEDIIRKLLKILDQSINIYLYPITHQYWEIATKNFEQRSKWRFSDKQCIEKLILSETSVLVLSTSLTSIAIGESENNSENIVDCIMKNTNTK